MFLPYFKKFLSIYSCKLFIAKWASWNPEWPSKTAAYSRSGLFLNYFIAKESSIGELAGNYREEFYKRQEEPNLDTLASKSPSGHMFWFTLYGRDRLKLSFFNIISSFFLSIIEEF